MMTAALIAIAALVLVIVALLYKLAKESETVALLQSAIQYREALHNRQHRRDLWFITFLTVYCLCLAVWLWRELK